MTKRLPILPTMIVIMAVGLMVGLGIWQLHRAAWKDSLLAQYGEAEKMPPISWPTAEPAENQLPLFRHATGVCHHIVGHRAVVGENLSGDPGYSQIVECSEGTLGRSMSVEVGWSTNPNAVVNWNGGPVSGIIGPDRLTRMRLVAASAPPGLERAAPPSIHEIPNNHLSYAIQWFAFAVIALVIYALALRKRLRSDVR